MRRCTFESFNLQNGRFVQFTGFFHQWGLEESEGVNYSVAIVEDEATKKIYTAMPNRVTFLD